MKLALLLSPAEAVKEISGQQHGLHNQGGGVRMLVYCIVVVLSYRFRSVISCLFASQFS